MSDITLTLDESEDLELTLDESEDLTLELSATVVASAVAWGAITGTLSAQTDLQAALDAKATQSYAQGLVAAHNLGSAAHETLFGAKVTTTDVISNSFIEAL